MDGEQPLLADVKDEESNLEAVQIEQQADKD